MQFPFYWAWKLLRPLPNSKFHRGIFKFLLYVEILGTLGYLPSPVLRDLNGAPDHLRHRHWRPRDTPRELTLTFADPVIHPKELNLFTLVSVVKWANTSTCAHRELLMWSKKAPRCPARLCVVCSQHRTTWELTEMAVRVVTLWRCFNATKLCIVLNGGF